MRFLKPVLVCGAVALAGLASGLGAAAQAPAPAGWESSSKVDGMVVLTHPTGDAVIIEGVGASAQTVESMLARTATMEECSGLSDARTVTALGGAGQMRDAVGDGIACRMIWGKQADGLFALSVSLEAEHGALGARTLQVSRMAGYVAPPPSAARTPPTRPQVPPPLARAAGTAPDDAALKAVLAKVPTQSRPVDVVLQTGWTFIGDQMQMQLEPVLLFPNGLATHCPEWDPLRVAATAEAFAQAGLECDLLPWRRSGAEYQIRDTDGAWGVALPGAENKGAKPGRRVSLTLQSLNRISTLGNWGSPGLLIINEGSLAMTTDGVIQMGSSRFTWRNADTESRTDAPLIGRYYLDGFLIAIGDEQGQVSVTSFLDVKSDQDTFVYLGDQLYFPPDP
jgi:hypothetical protein